MNTMWKESHTSERSSDDVISSEARQISLERATIGPSLRIKGNLSGEEDLLIEGRVEGEVTLEGNDLTVGSKAHIKANLRAKVISIDGEVCGDLFGQEKIVIRKTGDVEGNLVAPRVILEDGATFKGSVDMEAEASQQVPARRRSERSVKRPDEKSKAVEMPPARSQ